MTINLEVKQRVERDQVAKKLRLERRLERVISSKYAELIREFDILYPGTGAAPHIETVAASTQSSLEAHYLIVQREFEGQFAEDVGAQLPEQAINLASFAFGAWIAERALFNATRIIATARNRLLSSIAAARNALTQEVGNVPTNGQALDAGKRIVAPVLRTQARLVGTVETQAASEATKVITAEAAGGLVPRNVAGLPSPLPPSGDDIVVARKTWLTQEDEVVRNRHVLTNGQERGVNDLFNVGGQSLMFPGDTSNGADLANVINCRCFSFFERVSA